MVVKSARLPFPRTLLWGLVLCAALVTTLSILTGKYAKPLLRARVVALLSEKFHADVQLGKFEVSVFRGIRVHGTDLSLRHEARVDVPPLIAVREFYASAGFRGLIGRAWKIDWVELQGLKITVPPRVQGASRAKWSRIRDIPLLIHRMVVDYGEIEILPKEKDKPSHLFAIHDLKMRSVGLLQAAAFSVEVTNPTPPGVIHAAGKFGPWNPDDPGLTPLSANYTFTNADLGVFKGISGTLSSKGQFGGVLNKIEVQGETDTPNFQVLVSGHPLNLHTTFSATVDGTNGNTTLHPVRAHFLRSVIVANGEVVKKPGAHGRSVVLDLKIGSARLEDLLQFAVKSTTPPMTGRVNLTAKFDLPPGSASLVDRLNLIGDFETRDLEFANPGVNEKIETMSRKGLGKPKDENAGNDVSNLQGRFSLEDGVMTFKDLNFAVEGADVQVEGTYGLDSERLNFHGDLRLKAKLSQTMTGFKSILLKPFDEFFRKNGMTQLPIRITGSRGSPSFGLDFHHKKNENP